MDYPEKYEIQEERLSFWSRLRERFFPTEDLGEEAEPRPHSARLQRFHPYHVCVRKEVHSLEDARLAADGLKEGKQQILNLASTPPGMRERIVDFLNGVVYALEGSVEKVGEHVFLYAPHQAIVEAPPPTMRLKGGELPG